MPDQYSTQVGLSPLTPPQVQEDLRKRELDSGGDLESGLLLKGKDGKMSEPTVWAFVSKIFIQVQWHLLTRMQILVMSGNPTNNPRPK